MISVVQFHGAHCERRLGLLAVACVAGRGKLRCGLGQASDDVKILQEELQQHEPDRFL